VCSVLLGEVHQFTLFFKGVILRQGPLFALFVKNALST
jgi:hypothetical protein